MPMLEEIVERIARSIFRAAPPQLDWNEAAEEQRTHYRTLARVLLNRKLVTVGSLAAWDAAIDEVRTGKPSS